ncbi:hypothetical protein [Sphingomonas sp. CFBP 8760]|uniref:hypothetical protein n=1 Tax=Sphingomonas sp. CFBP 8760 TaxID=2775282 RepID=UPI00178507B6|nr:hypothetical protein [Sphingomonas sp. CFBP 8760]MBD8546639.1 hypothetical protein [Sphingomonas sp. CFBP 8760]
MPDPTDPHPHSGHTGPDGFGDLPIQPTGSGVADLEIAYEQMRLGEDDDRPVDPDVAIPTEDTADAADSAAHPS